MVKTLIATFDDPRPAELLSKRFTDAGIEARVVNDFFLQRFIYLTKPAATK